MLTEWNIDPLLLQKMAAAHIDLQLTLQILNNLNHGLYDQPPFVAAGFPSIDGEHVMDLHADHFDYPYASAQQNYQSLFPESDLTEYGELQADMISFSREQLRSLGMKLYPFAGYGILNGGSATSYIDQHKNHGFSKRLLGLLAPVFEKASAVCQGKPKGITPAFFNQDGSGGPTYMVLKIRALLIEALRYKTLNGGAAPEITLFQMTSFYTDELIKAACEGYRNDPLIAPLIEAVGYDLIADIRSAVQPLMAAFTQENSDGERSIFSQAYGEQNRPLPLPGGHGQCFRVLRDIFSGLLAEGKRYVYLTNIDNLGNTIEPVALAMLLLSGKIAAFEFSFKTAVDVKGGVLVRDTSGHLYCADMGASISREEIVAAEKAGQPILFNCATGLFDLQQFMSVIDTIIERLPMRVTDQIKDAGRYSQVEQITWEVMSLLDDFLVLGVEKRERFLAAKLLLENLVSSGVSLEDAGYPEELRQTAHSMHTGMVELLEGVYGMKKSGQSWRPLSPQELTAQWG